MEYLILIRHGVSEYNVKGLWTGWDNPPLANEGIEDAKKAAETLRSIPIDMGFTSIQKRHKDTLDIVKSYLGKNNLPITEDKSLNERNYGIYTGKNKWEVKKEVGDETFLKIRRSWDYPIPEGESLKQTYDRVVIYYKKVILPTILSGKNVIISSSGNALRSLVKFMENISDEDITKLEIAPGEVYVYCLDEQGKIINKEIRNHHSNVF
jgi:2,3-bisphosphoglycerate-dependent phosphoglycerate mutase